MKENKEINENINENENVNENVNAETQQAEEPKAEGEAQEPEKSADPLDVALEEIASLKDKYLRTAAEFDNYRKRTVKEKAELILNGSEKALKALLPIIDDMERALAGAEKTDDAEVLREGMRLIYQKTTKMMESLGVSRMETENADFDTDYHEAVAMVPGMGDDKKGKVLDCVQTGYMLNQKVLRHAKVAVGQ